MKYRGHLFAFLAGASAGTGTILQKIGVPPDLEFSMDWFLSLFRHHLIGLFIIGVLLTISSTALISNAFRYGQSNVLFAMMGGTYAISIVFISAAALGEWPNIQILAGMGMIIAGILLIVRR